MIEGQPSFRKEAMLPGMGRARSKIDDSRCGKRTRVSIACQRCKMRKQKCDGSQPACLKCRGSNADCIYIIPNKPMPFGKNHYISSLEQRVEELEALIARDGRSFIGEHFVPLQETATQPTRADVQAETPRVDELLSVATGLSNPQTADPIAKTLVDLSLNMKEGYLDATTFTSLAQMLGVLVDDQPESDSSSTPSFMPGDVLAMDTASADLGSLPDSIADRLLEGYLRETSTRWPVLHSTWLKKLHHQRRSASDVFECFTLHLVYAIGGRTLETSGAPGLFAVERHYELAIQLLPKILQLRDVRQVCSLILLAIWGTRSPSRGESWTYSRMAMTKAIDLGLHRQLGLSEEVTLENQMRRRIFWSCYTFDRMFCIPIGRPFAIADADIDVGLPLDVDENCVDQAVLQQAQKTHSNGFCKKSTTLSLFCHIVKLRRIESEIQKDIYRVDQPVQLHEKLIRSFLAKLAAWKDNIPEDINNQVQEGLDKKLDYMIYYNKALRLLLYATLSNQHLGRLFLGEFMQACSNLGRCFKRLHQDHTGPTIITVQTVFLAGLNLMYCVFMDPRTISSVWAVDSINTCSTVLYVIAERMPQSKRYRDIFERVREHIIEPMIGGSPLHFRPSDPSLRLDSYSSSNWQADHMYSENRLSHSIDNMEEDCQETEGESTEGNLLEATLSSTHAPLERVMQPEIWSLEASVNDMQANIGNDHIGFPFDFYDAEDQLYTIIDQESSAL